MKAYRETWTDNTVPSMPTPWRRPISTAIASLLLASTHALAQPSSSALADCAGLAVDSERLACFDRVTGRAARPVAAPMTEAAPAPAASPAGSTAASPATSTHAPSAAAAPAGSGSMYDKAWGFDPGSTRYDLSLYAPNYFLFGRYTSDVNSEPFDPLIGSVLAPYTELDSTEAAFQLSFKFRLWTTDDRRFGVWAAYTQQSQWQLYNDSGNASRPFRDTNYMPEVILSYKPGLEWGGLQWNLFNLSFNHQSNGRTDTLSRSWNRMIASFGVEQGNLGLLGRLWWRIPEDSDKDDNPTITDYYGWGDVSAIYKWRDQSFSGTLRGNPNTGKGAVQLTFTSAPLLGALRGYVKFFSGYGETLIDYNWNQSTIGFGVSLNDWL